MEDKLSLATSVYTVCITCRVMCFDWCEEIAADEKGTSCVSVCGLALSV